MEGMKEMKSATINGIEVKAEMSEVSSTGNIPTLFSLSWNNGSSFTSTKTATVDGTTDTNYTLGGSADTWGRAWTDSELSNANFRVRMDKSTDSDTLNVDYLAVKVYYTTNGTGTTTIQYVLTDHLGGTNVVTSNTGAITQVLDYYPFGGTRISSSTSGFDERKKFIGIERDTETGLDYALNRYYANTRGNFITEDPVFWEVNLTKDGKTVMKNPQLQNSYSYAGNNPITQKDPDGRIIDTALDIGFIGYDLYRLSGAISNGGDVKGELRALSMDAIGAALPGVTGLGMVARVADKGGDAARGITKIGGAGKRVSNGLPPEGLLPPGFGSDGVKIGPASKASKYENGGRSIWDNKGGEWRYAPEDNFHNEHWDYNPWTSWNTPWKNVPMNNKPPVKYPDSSKMKPLIKNDKK